MADVPEKTVRWTELVPPAASSDRRKRAKALDSYLAALHAALDANDRDGKENADV